MLLVTNSHLLFAQDCCDCHKWEKTTREKKHRRGGATCNSYTCEISAHFDEEEKTVYKTGCGWDWDGYRDLGIDPECCQNLKKQYKLQETANEKARIAQEKENEKARIEDLRIENNWQKNKQKHLTKDRFIVDEWHKSELALPWKGHKGNYFREWEDSDAGNVVVSGEIINGKKENIWKFTYRQIESFMDSFEDPRYGYIEKGFADPKEYYDAPNDLWIYFKNDEVIYADTKEFEISEVYQKIKERDDRENEKKSLAEKISKNLIADGFFNEAKEKLILITSLKNNTINEGDSKSNNKFKIEIEFSVNKLESALNLYSNDKTESIFNAKSKLELAKSYLDTINNIHNLEFDLAMINPQVNLELKQQIINNIKLSVYENCIIKLSVLIKSNNGESEIYIDNIESECRNTQIKDIIKNIVLLTHINPIYYFGISCKTKTSFNIEVQANSIYKKFTSINESIIKMKGFNIKNDAKSIKNLALNEKYNDGLELLKNKPFGKYYFSNTDFQINGIDEHKEYLSKYKSFGGSANCIYSLVIPGLGKMAITRGRKGWGDLLAVASFGAATYFVNELKNKSYVKYNNATALVDKDKYLYDAKQYNLGVWSLGIIGGYIWLMDIVEVYKMGERNEQNERDFKRHSGKFTIGLSASNLNQKIYPIIGLKYNFIK